MSSAEPEDVVLDIDSLKTFTIPKRKKSKTGAVVYLNQYCCLSSAWHTMPFCP